MNKCQLVGKLWWQHPLYPELCSVHSMFNIPIHLNLYVTTLLSRLLLVPSNLIKTQAWTLWTTLCTILYDSRKKTLSPQKTRQEQVLSFPLRLQNRLYRAQLEKG